MKQLTEQELARYRRNIIVEGFGEESQTKLKNASVLVVGAGGLGSAVLQYITAAGVGRIGIMEFDVVSDSNLQRQVLYNHGDMWRFKIDIAADRIRANNPETEIVKHNAKLTIDNAPEIFPQYDIVVDCTDNYESRYVIDYFSALYDKPMIYGTAQGMTGQVSIFNYGDAGCYSELYPEPDIEADRMEVGVISPMPGIVGTIQAMEVIKLITDCGDPLVGKLLMIDAKNWNFSIFEI